MHFFTAVNIFGNFYVLFGNLNRRYVILNW